MEPLALVVVVAVGCSALEQMPRVELAVPEDWAGAVAVQVLVAAVALVEMALRSFASIFEG
jgi:hypothetical protein